MSSKTKNKTKKKLRKNSCKKYKTVNNTINKYEINVYNAPKPKESVILKTINILIKIIKRILN